MQFNIINSALVATALLFSANSSMSAEQKTATVSSAASPAKPPVKGSKQDDIKVPVVPRIKLVDINRASRIEMKTLAGITDSEADKIIAGRPFGSKAQLTTRGILTRDVYEQLKKFVVAKQDAGTAAKLLKK